MVQNEHKVHQQSFYTLLMFGVALIWGFGFIATKKALDAGYGEAFILAVRFCFAAVFFGFVARNQLKDCSKADVVGGILSGIFLFLGFSLQIFGLALTTPSNNALITAANIVFVPFFAWVVFRKRPTAQAFGGALLCFAGIVVLSVDFNNLGAFGRGDLLSFFCAIAFAVHTVTMGYFAVRGNIMILNFFQMLVAGLCAALQTVWVGKVSTGPALRLEFLWIIYLTFFSTVVAYFVHTMVLKHVPPSRVSIIMSSESVLAAVFSLLLGYESMRPALLIGGMMVVCAVILVERKPKT